MKLGPEWRDIDDIPPEILFNGYWGRLSPVVRFIESERGGENTMWKKIGKFLLEVFIPWAASKMNRNKAAKLIKVVDVATDTIEAYNDIRETRKDTAINPVAKVKLIKKIAGEFAKDVGLDSWLKDRVVKKYTDKAKRALKEKADKILERIMR